MRNNQAALVTGGAIRLGKAISLVLAKQGYDIALHYNTSYESAQKTCEEIKSLGVTCEIFQSDLSKAENLKPFLESVRKTFTNLNTLVNSASGYAQATIKETKVATFDAQFAINLRAPFFLSKTFAEICKAGTIINICDNKIGFNQFEYAAYLLTKKALAEFTKLAALEFAPNIRVNAISPGVVMPMSSRSNEYIDWRIQGIPLNKQGTTQHIGDALLFLINNNFVTGQVIFVDGGEVLTGQSRNAAQYNPEKV